MDRPDQSDAEAAMMNRIEEAVHRAVVNALKENTAQRTPMLVPIG